MTVRMRHTSSHTKNRRSHHALEGPRLSACPKCGAAHLRHRACMQCGTYRGRVVFDAAARDEKKAVRVERKRKEMGEDPTAKREEKE